MARARGRRKARPRPRRHRARPRPKRHRARPRAKRHRARPRAKRLTPPVLARPNPLPLAGRSTPRGTSPRRAQKVLRTRALRGTTQAMRHGRGKLAVARTPAGIGHKCAAMRHRAADVLPSVAAVDTASAWAGVVFAAAAAAALEVAGDAGNGWLQKGSGGGRGEGARQERGGLEPTVA